MTIKPGETYTTGPNGFYRVLGMTGGRVRFEVLDGHQASAGGVFTMDESTFVKMIEEAESMTNEQKIELIQKEPDLTPQEFNALPTEARAFLWAKWYEKTEADRDLYFEAWSRRPGTLEHAVKAAECTPADLATAARVLRTIWAGYETSGAKPGDIKNQTAVSLIEAIDWRARKCE